VTGFDGGNITRADLALLSTVRLDAQPAREAVQKVRRLAAVGPCKRLQVLRPPPAGPSCRALAFESPTSTVRGGLTTIVGSSPKPAGSLQSSAAGRSCRVASGPAGGQAMSDSRPVLRQPRLRAVRPRAPPTPQRCSAGRQEGCREALHPRGPGPAEAWCQEREPVKEGAG
jgi:hypothetical protein